MTQKNVELRKFTKYVSLNMLGMLGISLYIMADTFFVANGVGAQGLAALNLALPVYSLISGLGLMLGMGGATRYTACMAKGGASRARRIFTLTVVLGAGLGVVIAAAGLILLQPIVGLLGARGDTADNAAAYLRFIFAFAPAFLLNNIFTCFVRNDGNPRLAMAAMLAGSLGNIVLDYVFIYPLGWSMGGAAFATGLAPVLGMAALSMHWRGGRAKLRFERGFLRAREAIKLAAVGLPSFVTEASAGIVMFCINLRILALSGDLAVAAYGIVANIALIVTAVYTGLAQGVQPLLSASRGDPDAVRKLSRWAFMLAAGLGIVFLAGAEAFARPIAGLFNGADDPMLAQMAVEGLRLYALAFLLMGGNIVAGGMLAARQAARPSLAISLLRGLLVLPLALGLSAAFSLTGVWMAAPACELLVLGVSVYATKKQSPLRVGQARRTADRVTAA